MISSEIQRFYFIIRIFLRYGFDELIPRSRITTAILFRLWRCTLFWIPNRHKDKQFAVRLRLALQELGPIWIKFGQMLSTRRDLLPPQVADELTLLQDKVVPFAGDLAKEQIEKAMGNLPIEAWFYDFNIIPLASASIAQVHTARLKENGKEVVIKIIRPDILPLIKADIQLIYRFVHWVSYLLSDGYCFRSIEVVREYEKTLTNELNLLQESANAMQLRRNFKNSSILYVPEVYSNYCSQNMMVMERIYGIPISDVSALKKKGINMKLLAERGVQIFLTQVFRDSFFHADMHPGNIFVSYSHPDDPYYIGIDCGIVGSLNKEDRYYLAKNFIAFFNRNYQKVAELHVDSGWVPPDTNIKEFELAIRAVCEPIFEKPLSGILFSHVLLNLFNIARKFQMEVQPQLVLLQKTLLYIEGIGLQLYPQLDLWKTAKPFLESWIKEQVGFFAFVRTVKNNIPFWFEKLPELPELIYDNLRQTKNVQHNINKVFFELKMNRMRREQSRYLFKIGATLFLSSILLFISQSNLDTTLSTLVIGCLVVWCAGWKKIH